MLIHKWIRELKENEKQSEALLKPGHTVVIAGPGSGKTRVLTTKIARLLLEEIRAPQGIVCLTYTRMMAKEIEQRLYALGVPDRPNIFVGTVHSFCLAHVVSPYARLFGMKIPDPIRIAPRELVDSLQSLSLRRHLKIANRATREQFKILRQLRADYRFDDWTDALDYRSAIVDYEKHLLRQGFLDFDLIIKVGLRLIISQPFVRNSLFAKFPWMAIDEYQDLGYPLSRLVTEMIDKTPTKLVAIGDPNQSIFDFAGTNPKYLIELSKRDDVQPTVVLNQNYRSAQEIIKIGDVILAENKKTLSDISGGHCTIVQCRNFEDQIVKSIEIAHVLMDEEKDRNEIAILHRKRLNINRIANSLNKNGIGYVIDKNQYYDRTLGIIKWLEDLAFWSLAGWKSNSPSRHNFDELLKFWLEIGVDTRLNLNENEARLYLISVLWKLKNPDELLENWVNTIYKELFLDSFLGKYSELNPDEVNEFQKIMKLSKKGNSLANLTVRKFSNLDSGIQLTTLHSSKGSEFNSVIITGVEEFSSNENEKRVLYVGATRAKKQLYLLYTISGSRPPKYIESIRQLATHENWNFVTFME